MATHFTSRANRVTVPTTDEAQFVRAALGKYLRASLRGRLRPARRTPNSVRLEYDHERASLLAQAAKLSWDELIYGDPEICDFVLVNDRIVWTTVAQPRARNLAALDVSVRALPHATATIVEFGCGTGRNLLFLKKTFPTIRCIGLELSPVSVELARAVASRFGLDVEFQACDVTAGVDLDPRSAELVFSCHALEQMPRVFPAVLRQMCDVSSDTVTLLEPVPELWPWDVRGVTSRLRVHALDRLHGIMPVVKRLVSTGDWEMTAAERMHTASNPLNETCRIVLRRRATGSSSGSLENRLAAGRPSRSA